MASGHRAIPTKYNKTASRIDRAIGQRIRAGRRAKGWSQTVLGEKVGVTCQQIQKYEKGYNWVGSGRLFEIAKLLGIPTVNLFDGKKHSGGSHNYGPFVLLDDPLTLQILEEFAKIHETGTRRALLALIEGIVRQAKQGRSS